MNNIQRSLVELAAKLPSFLKPEVTDLNRLEEIATDGKDRVAKAFEGLKKIL